jgi:hypothetical protein
MALFASHDGITLKLYNTTIMLCFKLPDDDVRLRGLCATQQKPVARLTPTHSVANTLEYLTSYIILATLNSSIRDCAPITGPLRESSNTPDQTGRSWSATSSGLQRLDARELPLVCR